MKAKALAAAAAAAVSVLLGGGIVVQALRVSPVAFDITTSAGASSTFSFRAINDESQPLRFRVEVCDWVRDLYGTNLFCEAAGEVPRSASAWIEVVPRQFRLEPDEAQDLRVTLRVPEAAPDGTPLEGSYWTAVMVEAVPEEAGGEPPGTEVVVKRRFGVKVLVTLAGTGRRDGQILLLERHGLNPLGVSLEFANRGTLNLPSVSGRIEVRDVAGTVWERIPVDPFPLLPGYVRRVTVQSARPRGKRLPPGDYALLAVLDYGGDVLVGAQLLLRVPELRLVPLAAEAQTPQDLDGDGFYEDVTGDGSLTEDDPVLLGAALESEAVQQNWPAFDFDNDGDVDFDDVLALDALRNPPDGSDE